MSITSEHLPVSHEGRTDIHASSLPYDHEFTGSLDPSGNMNLPFPNSDEGGAQNQYDYSPQQPLAPGITRRGAAALQTEAYNPDASDPSALTVTTASHPDGLTATGGPPPVSFDKATDVFTSRLAADASPISPDVPPTDRGGGEQRRGVLFHPVDRRTKNPEREEPPARVSSEGQALPATVTKAPEGPESNPGSGAGGEEGNGPPRTGGGREPGNSEDPEERMNAILDQIKAALAQRKGQIPTGADVQESQAQALTRFLRESIKSGALPEKTVLPGSRRLASYLAISLTDVDEARGALADEGLVTARKRIWNSSRHGH